MNKTNSYNWYFLTNDLALGEGSPAEKGGINVHCILNEEGNVEQELSFDPYGNRRNPLTWQPFEYNTEPAYLLDRGYTMHEHWDNFSLINMNGRVYDPVIARFLNPDPYVQMPDYSQNFNRYSYVMNNPLIYTDPSGEIVITFGAVFAAVLVSAAIDYAVQVAVNYAQNPNGSIEDNFYNNIDFFDVTLSGVVGGLTMGFGAGPKAATKIGRNIHRFNKYVVPFIKAKVDYKGQGGWAIKSDADALLNYGISFMMNNASRTASESLYLNYSKTGIVGKALKEVFQPLIIDGTGAVIWDRAIQPMVDKEIRPYLPAEPILIVPPTNPEHP